MFYRIAVTAEDFNLHMMILLALFCYVKTFLTYVVNMKGLLLSRYLEGGVFYFVCCLYLYVDHFMVAEKAELVFASGLYSIGNWGRDYIIDHYIRIVVSET